MGTVFLFRIVVPGIDEPLNIKGYVQKVVTSEAAAEGESAGMDIQFEYEQEDEREILMRRVHALIDESLGFRLGEKIRMYIEERNA